MADELPTPTKYEELAKDQVRMILEQFPGPQTLILGLHDLDPTLGAGIIDNSTKCLWTRDGRRITISFGGGALTASCTKEKDPLADLEARG